MIDTVKVKTERFDENLRMKIEFDIAREVANCTVVEVERLVKAAVIDELQKSTEFQEAVRRLALQRLFELCEPKEKP